MTRRNEPGTWADILDGIFEDKSVRVVFEHSDQNRIYVDVSLAKDRAEYIGFYLTKADIAEIYQAFGGE